MTKHFINQNPLDSFLLQCFFSYKNKINLRLDVQMCVTRHHYNGFFMGHCTEKHTSIWDFFHRIRLIMRFHCKFEWTDILLRGKKNKKKHLFSTREISHGIVLSKILSVSNLRLDLNQTAFLLQPYVDFIFLWTPK